MTALALTIPVARRSPIHIPRRDIAIDGGDTLILNLTLVESDNPDAAPLDLVGIGPQLRMLVYHYRDTWDYGWWRHCGSPVWSSLAATFGDLTGRATITMPKGTALRWGPRAGWMLQLDYPDGVSALCQGALHISRGFALETPSYDLLNDAFVDITDETPSDIEV